MQPDLSVTDPPAGLSPAPEPARECARLFSSRLESLKTHREPILFPLQAQQYAWMKEYYPEIAAGIREAIARGRWKPAGMFWVTPDCHFPSGESLVRQILHGKNFLMDELHCAATEATLPAGFGCCPALPQILRKAGFDSLASREVPSDRFLPFPHRTFLWEGIDGTRLRTEILPADASAPAKTQSSPVGLPVWVGELCLEQNHGGACTAHARNKKGNRKSELLLREAEFFDVIAGRAKYEVRPGVVEDHRAAYDLTARHATTAAGYLERAWKLLLLNQSSDLPPGSVLRPVDRTSDYAAIFQLAQAVVCPARHAVAGRVDTGAAERPVLVFNASGFARAEVVSLEDGTPIHVSAPPCGYAVADIEAQRPVASFAHPVEVIERKRLVAIDNGMLRLIIERATGNILKIRDHRHDREVLAAGLMGNVFELHRDEIAEELSGVELIEVVENNPLRATIRTERKFGDSTIVQHITMRAASPRIDFDTEVEWREEEGRILKVAFPVNVLAPRATYEIQYGNVGRPTHSNDGRNAARFETCAQRWADLSEGDYGVALLNDCKYGYGIHGNVLRLGLLRSPAVSAPDADGGYHQFTYSLLPHGGNFRDGCVIEQSCALNMPLRVLELEKQTGDLPARRGFFQVDREGLIVEAVKHAERTEAVVVRLYEAYGTRGEARLTTTLPVKHAFSADLMERAGAPVECRDGEIVFTVSPYEIVTFLLILA